MVPWLGAGSCRSFCDAGQKDLLRESARQTRAKPLYMKLNTLKLASLSLVAYAVFFLFDSVVYARIVGAPTLWGRVLVYVPLVLLLAWGLWQAKRWAWLGSTIFTAAFGLMGLLALSGGLSSGAWRSRPYPVIDLLIGMILTAIFVVAFILLLLPTTKRAIQEAASTP